MSALFDGFEDRVHRVYELLRSPETAFVLVATPEEQVLQEALFFRSKVEELGMALRAVVFNRVHRQSAGSSGSAGDCEDLEERLAEILDDRAPAQRIAANHRRYQLLGRGESRRVANFGSRLEPGVVVVEVPNFAGDVHSLEGLRGMHEHLFAVR